MRFPGILLAASLALVPAAPAVAVDAATYDYLEARYTLFGELEGGGGDADVNGLGLEASRTFGPHLFVRLDSDLYEVDGGANDSPLDLLAVGPGVRVDLNAPGTATLWGRLSYDRVGAGRVGTGFGFDAGVRAQITDRIDIGFTLKTADTDAGNRDISYDTWEVEGAFAATDQVDLTASMVNGEIDFGPGASADIDMLLRFGVRLPF